MEENKQDINNSANGNEDPATSLTGLRQVRQPGNPANESGKNYLKHVLVFFILLAVVGGGYWVWNSYFSEGAKYSRQVEENMKKYSEWEANYTRAMTEDVYGGKTPQETLNMFVDALKREDVDLASKYFLLNSVGQVDQKWVDGLREAKESGKLDETIKLLEIAKPAGSVMKDFFGFEIRNNKGELLSDINMQLNTFSKIWKIESL